MEIRLDNIDHAIIEILSENAKAGTKEIAEQVGLSVTPTYERIKRLERLEVIQGYTTRLNKKLLGRGMEVLCEVSLKEHNLELLETFESKVVNFDEVVTCYHIAGDQDYILKIEVADMEAYEQFLKQKMAKIPSISNVHTSFVLRKLK